MNKTSVIHQLVQYAPIYPCITALQGRGAPGYIALLKPTECHPLALKLSVVNVSFIWELKLGGVGSFMPAKGFAKKKQKTLLW